MTRTRRTPIFSSLSGSCAVTAVSRRVEYRRILRRFGWLAQLVRAPVSHTGGHRFESCAAHYMRLYAGTAALLICAACIDDTGVVGPAKCVDVAASSDVPTWTLDLSWPNLWSVWGSSATDVFAVGQNGVILHYDGTSWRAESSGTTNALVGVWGTSANDVFAVGYSNFIPPGLGEVILHYDGTSWTPQLVYSGTLPYRLSAVWGSSPTDVYAVGTNGQFLHYDGLSWTPGSTGSSVSLSAIWGTSSKDIFAVGGNSIVHYDGTRWTSDTVAGSGTPGLLGIGGSFAGNVFAVGTILECAHATGCTPTRGTSAKLCGTWIAETLSVRGLRRAWGASPTEIYAVGDSGTILRRDGQSWAALPVGFTTNLSDIWGVPGGVLFAVGGGAILRGTR